MAKWWREIAELWRGLPEVIKAQRLLRRARRLRRDGKIADAFRLAAEAFVILRAEAHTDDPAARAIVATDAVLLDQLAHDLGHGRATRDDVALALQICEDTVRDAPRLKAMLQQHVDWYRHRLSKLGDDTVH